MVRKSNKGITLIALIITIIVLLILAGVTISFVVGDNGVVTQAQKAKIKTDQVSVQEAVDLEVVGSYDDNANLDFKLLNENLIANLPGIKLKKKEATGDKEDDFEEINDTNKIESLPATVRYKGVNVKINEKQLISNVAKDVDNYGMYVDYPINLDGDENTSDWKIFYEDETGRVFLIAADYVPNNCSALKTAMDEDHSKMNSYSVCCEYWSRSREELLTYHCYDGKSNINHTGDKANKKQCSFPETFMLARTDNGDEHTNNHYYCSSHVGGNGESGYANSRCASALQCTGNWSSFVKSSYADYAIGGPTLEMWVASWNQRHGKKEDDDESSNGITLFANGNNNTSGTGYCIGEAANCEYSHKDITGCEDGYNDTLYFPHKESSRF